LVSNTFFFTSNWFLFTPSTYKAEVGLIPHFGSIKRSSSDSPNGCVLTLSVRGPSSDHVASAYADRLMILALPRGTATLLLLPVVVTTLPYSPSFLKIPKSLLPKDAMSKDKVTKSKVTKSIGDSHLAGVLGQSHEVEWSQSRK